MTCRDNQKKHFITRYFCVQRRMFVGFERLNTGIRLGAARNARILWLSDRDFDRAASEFLLRDTQGLLSWWRISRVNGLTSLHAPTCRSNDCRIPWPYTNSLDVRDGFRLKYYLGCFPRSENISHFTIWRTDISDFPKAETPVCSFRAQLVYIC